MERKNDPLPISTVGSRGKGPKRYYLSFDHFTLPVLAYQRKSALIFPHNYYLQGWAVPHNVEWAGNISEDSRRGDWQAPASSGLHHRLPQQTSRGGGPEEEREEERGEGGQDREKWQQGDGRQKLAGLGEVSSAREPSVCFSKNNLVYHFSMWIHSLFLLNLLDTTEKKEIKEPNFNISDVCSSVSKTKGFDG